MKIIIKKINLPVNPGQLMRMAGYGFIIDRQRDKESYVRRLTRDHYPRFHVYIKEEKERIIFDMHLDQKQASYKGAAMHNAEYEGGTIENEILRIKEIILRLYREEKDKKNV
jgi:hypothetical protein